MFRIWKAQADSGVLICGEFPALCSTGQSRTAVFMLYNILFVVLCNVLQGYGLRVSASKSEVMAFFDKSITTKIVVDDKILTDL